MNDNDLNEFSILFSSIAEYYRQPLNPEALRFYWNALRLYDLVTVRNLVNEHVQTSKFMPAISELLDQVRVMDGRPSVEGAWAIVAQALGNESVTIVWTQEMATAFGVALGLYDDKVAARMAFKESYAKEVQDARRNGVAVAWTQCLGWDVAGRDGPLLKAMAEGKLTPAHAQQFLSGPAPREDMQRLIARAVKHPQIGGQP